ncbi:MAG: NAD(P)/FAD-dependent oxidoreductase [Acidobacteriota bacterium]
MAREKSDGSKGVSGRKKYDVAIIGAGPAGLTAGLFCRFRKLSTIVFEAHSSGGQLTFLYPAKKVHDYPSHRDILAGDLARAMVQQTLFHGIALKEMERVEKIDGKAGNFKIISSKNIYRAKVIILSVGMGVFKPRKLSIAGEREYFGRGLCYRLPENEDISGKRVVCIGGGNSSLEAAIYCKDSASDVIILCKSHSLDAFETYIYMIKKEKIRVIYGVEPQEVYGGQKVEGIRVFHTKSKKQMDIPANVIVINIGSVPDFDLVSNWSVRYSSNGVVVDPFMRTSRKGIFACGDMVDYPGKLRLLISASGEAAIAAESAYRFIRSLK